MDNKEQLTIKHIAPYLPYGLQIASRKNKSSIYGTYTLEIENNNDKGILNVLHGVNQIPILRPLSDLTKEIEVNGERFVPSVKYPELEISFYSCFCFFDGRGQNENIEDLPHHVFQWLISLNFDVFGLIDKGLAIDLNTITNG